jgi:hypothetical protein
MRRASLRRRIAARIAMLLEPHAGRVNRLDAYLFPYSVKT